MVERRWRVRFGAAAELDFANIVKWTAENFGARPSRVCRDTLVQAINELPTERELYDWISQLLQTLDEATKANEEISAAFKLETGSAASTDGRCRSLRK